MTFSIKIKDPAACATRPFLFGLHIRPRENGVMSGGLTYLCCAPPLPAVDFRLPGLLPPWLLSMSVAALLLCCAELLAVAWLPVRLFVLLPALEAPKASFRPFIYRHLLSHRCSVCLFPCNAIISYI